MLVVKSKVHQRAKVQSHSNIVSHEQFTLFSVSISTLNPVGIPVAVLSVGISAVLDF